MAIRRVPGKPTKKTAARSTKKSTKRAAKPAFSSTRANSLFNSLAGKVGRDPRATQASKDWRALISSQFALTSTQVANLKAIPAAESARVQGGVTDMMKNGGNFRITLGTDAKAGGNGELLVQLVGSSTPSKGFKITIIKCNFDANCRNWHCKIGPFSF
jgi:hypothetical protein